MNKYIDFVSDEDLTQAVKTVLDSYNKKDEKTILELLENNKNTTDEFKTIFDLYGNNSSLNKWKDSEIIREHDKTINNKIGEFHQQLLGKVPGWIDLGVGDETGADLCNEDKTVFIELKNKYNTMNHSSMIACREKLENILDEYPDATVYWAYIISKNYESVNEPWIFQGKENDKIRKISGNEVYKLITGKTDALKELYYVLPRVIEDINSDYNLLDSDKKVLKEYGKFIFKD